MKRIFILASVLVLPLAVPAQTFDEYLALRRTHKISQSVGAAALETFIGSRVMEVRGRTTGMIGNVLILENPDPNGKELYVKAPESPEWLKSGSQNVRLIVKAIRESETSMITAELLGAITEPSIAAWEDRQNEAARQAELKRAQDAARRSAGSTTSRSGVAPRVPSGKLPTMAARAGSRALSPEVRALIPTYAGFIRNQNRRLSAAKATDIAESVLEFSVYFGVDARLIMALLMAESNFNPNAVSHAGARGLGQLMPGTARGLGVSNSFDTEQNLYGTTKLLRSHLENYTNKTGDSFRGLVLALAAYNAGPGAVRRHGGVPPFRETQNYVRKVVEYYKRLSGEK